MEKRSNVLNPRSRSPHSFSLFDFDLIPTDLQELGAEGIKTKLDYKIVVDNFDAEYEYITNEGIHMYTLRMYTSEWKY